MITDISKYCRIDIRRPRVDRATVGLDDVDDVSRGLPRFVHRGSHLHTTIYPVSQVESLGSSKDSSHNGWNRPQSAIAESITTAQVQIPQGHLPDTLEVVEVADS